MVRLPKSRRFFLFLERVVFYLAVFLVLPRGSTYAETPEKELRAFFSPISLSVHESPKSPFWEGIPSYTFAEHETIVPSSCAVKVQWDKHFLYVLFDVDDSFIENSVDPWDGDSVSIILRNPTTQNYCNFRFSIEEPKKDKKIRKFQSKIILKPGSSLNDCSDLDRGFWVLMKIRWSVLKICPKDGIRIPMNLLAVNHNARPGAKYYEEGVEFSKIFWDKGDAHTAGGWVTLTSTPSPIQIQKTLKIDSIQESIPQQLRQYILLQYLSLLKHENDSEDKIALSV